MNGIERRGRGAGSIVVVYCKSLCIVSHVMLSVKYYVLLGTVLFVSEGRKGRLFR